MHSRASENGSAPRETADPLAAVISLLRPQTVLSKVITGAGRWGVRYPAHEDPGFCLMLEGTCFLNLDGVGVVKLEEGDFVLIPALPGFTMASDLSVKPKLATGTSNTSTLRHGTQEGPPSMRQLGGFFRFDRTNSELLVRFMPSLIHIRRSDPGASRVRRVVELISEETTARRAGRDLILERLVEVLLVEALRFRPGEAASQNKGLLAGLADPALARALRRLHNHVARRWTVADLARAAGMSRAAFAERFNRTVGMPPIEYLLEWRIAIAKGVLSRGRTPLTEVAEMIGYQSASAFSTAFTRHVGCSPSEFARSTQT